MRGRERYQCRRGWRGVERKGKGRGRECGARPVTLSLSELYQCRRGLRGVERKGKERGRECGARPVTLYLNPSPTSSALIYRSCSPRTTPSLTIAKSAIDFNFLSAPSAAHPSTASVHPKVCTTACEGQVYLSLPPGVAAPDVQVMTSPYH